MFGHEGGMIFIAVYGPTKTFVLHFVFTVFMNSYFLKELAKAYATRVTTYRTAHK